MGRLVKCPYCEDKFDKDESIEHNKRYYHPKCFETMKKESQDYQNLMDYISELYRVNTPNLGIKKQIKNYKEDGFKYKGMELALRYFFESLGNRVLEENGVGIIPYVYEDAKRDYIKRMKIAESFSQLESEKETVVYIKPSAYKRKNKQIDISNI